MSVRAASCELPARIAAPAARCRDPSELNVGAHGNDAALWQAEEIYRALRRACQQEEESLAPRVHAGIVTQDDGDLGDEIGRGLNIDLHWQALSGGLPERCRHALVVLEAVTHRQVDDAVVFVSEVINRDLLRAADVRDRRGLD